MAKLNKIKKKKSYNQNNNFLDGLKKFILHIEGLQKAIDVSMLITLSLHEKEREKITKFIDEKGKNLKIVNGTKTFGLEVRDQSKYEKLNNEEEKSEIAIKLIPRSIFVSLVSQFDLLVADLIKAVLVKYPTAIPKEKSLTFDELMNFTSIKDVQKYFIDEEVDKILRGDHAGHVDWFEKKIGVRPKEPLGKQWDTFIELTERRNLFVHADGIVNDYYINNCKRNCIEFDDNLKKGETLAISPKYFKKAYEALYEISAKLSWIVWRKIEPRFIEEIDAYFNDVMVIELIKQEQYQLSESIISFMVDDSNLSSDLRKNMFLINLALAKKLKGDIVGAENLLNAKDWSACNMEFRLAVHILRGQFEDAFILMKKIGKESDLLSKESYESDPIYKDLRETSKFKEVFKKIYGKEYVSNEEDTLNEFDKKEKVVKRIKKDRKRLLKNR